MTKMAVLALKNGRVGVVAADVWSRNRIADAIEWMVQSQWPPELCAVGVFSSSARGLAGLLSARAAFFSGEQVKCERVVRSRFAIAHFFSLPFLLSSVFLAALPSKSPGGG